MSKLQRKSGRVMVTIANGESDSSEFDMSEFAGGIIIIPAEWTAAGLSFLVSDRSGGTFVPLIDSDGTTLVEVPSVSATGAYTIPAEVFGADSIKLRSQTGGTPVNQGADRVITLILKG
jgi:hypothetical protein